MSTDGNSGEGTNEGGQEGTGTGTVIKPTLSALIKEHSLQEEANTMMADNRKKLTSQNIELVTQLEQLRKNSLLTQEDRDGLQVRITQLEEQYMTKEELAKRESTKVTKEYTENLDRAIKTGESWKGRYTDSTIRREWQDAAIEGEVLEQAITQVADMFRHQTQLIEHVQDGKNTGIFNPVVKFNDIDGDGNKVILDLSPKETIKRMKELPDRYGYLFKGSKTEGFGGSGSTPGVSGQPSLQELKEDPVKYAKWRKENPDLDFSKLKR